MYNLVGSQCGKKKKLWVTGELKPLPESLETVINMIQHGL